jgi:ABC-type sugar transport system ATPase subunit
MTVSYVAQDVHKSYGQNEVLKNITVEFKSGEIHALVGHNGAGKSTLLRVLAGVEKADDGSVILDDKAVSFSSPREAQLLGVTCVYQELRLVNELTVAENIFLGQELHRGTVLKKKEMNRQAAEMLAQHGLDISPDDKVSKLSHPQRQLVEIVSALHKNARFLLLDEPTTSLEFQQIQELLETLKKLVSSQEVGVVLVTHKLDEVYAVADKITVLCDGKVVLSGNSKDIKQQDVVGYIIGEEQNSGDGEGETSLKKDGVKFIDAEPALKVANLRTPKIKDVTLQAFPQQVLGIYGLGGSGRTEFLRALFGMDRKVSGNMSLQGKVFAPKSPRDALRRGVAYITEERKVDGFNPLMNSVMNMGLPVLSKFSRYGFIRKRKLQKEVLNIVKPLQIRGNISAPMQSLSGGNQQKVLFGRIIMQDAQLLLLDEPTKGIDIGAKSEIYKLIRSLVESKPIAVIVVSSEEEEILAISDQIVIFRSGVCDGKLYRSEEMTATRLRTLALEEG